MNRITETRALNSTVTLMKVEAPDGAKRAKAGQFIILRVDDKGERIPLTVADTDPATGEVTIMFQVAGATTRLLSMMKAESPFVPLDLSVMAKMTNTPALEPFVMKISSSR